MDEQERRELATEVATLVVNAERDLLPDLSDEIAAKVGAATKPGVLKNAGEAVGLIAGVVALAYLMGGVVLLLRMMRDEFRAEQAVAVIGQLPREFVVSLGFVEVLGSAAIIGILAALIAVAVNRPKAQADPRPLTKPPQLLILLFLLAGAIAGVAIAIFIVTDGWSWALLWNLAAVPFTFLALVAGWRRLRLAGGELEHRTARVLLVGLVFTVIAVPATLAAAALVKFEPVRLCVTGYSRPVYARQIALTDKQAVVARNDTGRRGQHTVVSFPAGAITRSDTGRTRPLPGCPAAQPPGKTAG